MDIEWIGEHAPRMLEWELHWELCSRLSIPGARSLALKNFLRVMFAHILGSVLMATRCWVLVLVVHIQDTKSTPCPNIFMRLHFLAKCALAFGPSKAKFQAHWECLKFHPLGMLLNYGGTYANWMIFGMQKPIQTK